MAKFKEGEVIKVRVPFEYTIGDTGYHTGKTLETTQDCIDEARAELDQVEASEFYLEAFDEDGELL